MNRYLTHDGRTMTMAQWSRETGIGFGTLRKRIEAGWSVASALTTPLHINGRNRKHYSIGSAQVERDERALRQRCERVIRKHTAAMEAELRAVILSESRGVGADFVETAKDRRPSVAQESA